MTLDATVIYNAAFNMGLAPDPDWLIPEWANERRVLPKGAAKEYGRYSWERTPYWREVMDMLSPSCPVQEVCVMKGVQIAATTQAENMELYVVDIAPGPIMHASPTAEMAEDYSKERFQAAVDAMPCLLGKIKEPRSRDSGNTIMKKTFPGGSITFVGSNTPRAIRSKAIRYLVLDDVDGFIDQINAKEGDICSNIIKRTTTFGSIRKVYINSTPTIKGISRIERYYLDSDQRQYHVPCPFCGTKQVLKWGGKEASFGLKFSHDGPTVNDAWYECCSCHKRIDEGYKPRMFLAGEWVPQNPSNKTRRGYHLSSLYSPLGWKSWLDICQEFLSAGRNPQLLQVWTNLQLAETWEEKGSQPDWLALRNRAEPYKIMEVPHGGLMLTAAMDVHLNRLEPSIWAWGRDEECWLIYHGAIYGSTEKDEVWKEADDFLSRPIPHALGTMLHLPPVAVDSGDQTQVVYHQCRKRRGRWFPVKGAKNKDHPVIGVPKSQDIDFMGERIKGGIKLWNVGTFVVKRMIYERLAETPPGPRTIHTPIGLDDEFYKQLTAEKLVTRYVKGFPEREWIKLYERNEVLDVLVYAYAAAIRAGLMRANWDSLERAIIPEKSEAKGESTYRDDREQKKSSYLKPSRENWLGR